jgi:HAD superfamily hydrolase (TIGR01509 family)
MTTPVPEPDPGTSPLHIWPPQWQPSAVVFDCDGLLVDSEAQWVQAQENYLAAHGTALEPGTRRQITGASAEVVVAAIARAVGKDPYAVGEDLLREHRKDLADHLVTMRGALDAVRAAARAVPVAVASNSPREMLDMKLRHLGLADVVDADVAIEDVAAPKPAPDLYLAACRALGSDPADTLGFEDSETGARSALDAGLQLLAIPSIPGQSPQGHRTLSSLEDPVLTQWLGGWEVRR